MNGVSLLCTKVMKMSKTIRYKNINADHAREIISKTNHNPHHQAAHATAANRRNGTITEIKVTKAHNIGHRIQSLHNKTKAIRKRTIRSVNNIGYLGKKVTANIDGSSESVNEGISAQVGNLNRQAIRAGRNVRLNQKIIRKRVANQKKKEERKDRLNVKVKFDNKVHETINTTNTTSKSSSKNSFYQSKVTNQKSKIKQTKIPAVKKKISQSAAKILNKSAKAKKTSGMVKAVEFSFKSIKGLIIALGSSGAALLAFALIIGAILLMVASPFSILLDDNPKTMRQKINEYYAEYRNDMNSRIEFAKMFPPSNSEYNTDNDRIRIIGPSPDIKEALKLYIVRNDEDPDGDVLIDTEEFDINKFKTAFTDLNQVASDPSITENTHQETRKNKKGKQETVTVLDSRDIIFKQSSETALHYAIRTEMTDSQIETIKELGDPEFDKAWENLLYGIQTFSYVVPGTMPYFNQGDYSNISYGPGSLASDGCGPTAFAMVVSYLKGTMITPPEIINWCGNSYYAWPDNGTMWSFFPAAADHYGIRCDNSDASFDEAIQALKEGKVVINVQRAGIFTNGGHFIVLRSITPEGKILVSDPNGYNANKWGLTIHEYNKKQWDPEQISASATHYWIFSSDMQIGGNPAEQVWLTLRARGLSEEVTAGILGNMMTECGGNTLDLQWNIHGHYYGSTFYGLCQWCLDFVPSSFDGCSIAEQLNHLLSDLPSQMNTFGSNYESGYNYERFLKAKDVNEAAAAFAACYERPGYEYNNYQQRRQNAYTAYKYFHGKKY